MNSRLYLAFFALWCLSFSINAQVNLDSGLIGCWPFNGNANDYSGNGNHGTVYGAILTEDRFGSKNSAYYLDGINDYIAVNKKSSFEFGSSDFSVSIWAYQYDNHTDYNGAIIGVWYSGIGPSKNEWIIWSGDSDGYPYFCLENSVNIYKSVSKTYFELKNWNHLVAIRSIDSLLLYYNEKKVSSSYIGTLSSNNTSFDLLMGTIHKAFDNPGRNVYANVSLDDIRIYNRAISQDEISALYNEVWCCNTAFYPAKYLNSIKIYPNPTNDNITIDFGDNYQTIDGYQLKVTNILNQIVYSTTLKQKSTYINLSTWTGNGIYFVHLINDVGHTVDINKIILK